MQSRESNDHKRDKHFLNISMSLFLLFLISMLIIALFWFLSANSLQNRLLFTYDFRSGILPNDVETSADLVFENGTHSLLFSHVGEQLQSHDFVTFGHLELSLLFVGITIEGGIDLATNAATFTCAGYDEQKNRIDETTLSVITLNQWLPITFEQSDITSFTLTMTNYVLSDAGPSFVYSAMLSRIIAYDIKP